MSTDAAPPAVADTSVTEGKDAGAAAVAGERLERPLAEQQLRQRGVVADAVVQQDAQVREQPVGAVLGLVRLFLLESFGRDDLGVQVHVAFVVARVRSKRGLKGGGVDLSLIHI